MSRHNQHEHEHDHGHTNNQKTLLISFIIITAFMVVEVVGGFITNSLALISDAGHMLSDSIALGIAIIAFKFSGKAINEGMTYGYRRFEILAATLNGITLIGIAIYIFYEAIQRFANPPDVATTGMMIIALIGLLINMGVFWIMFRGGDIEKNLNMRSAYLHVISDMLGSIGAVFAALLIMFFGWGWADPLASVIVAALVLRSGYFVTKSSLHVLMEGTPNNVNMDEIVQVMLRVNGVKSVHDVHVWTITSNMNVLTAHIVVDGERSVYETEALVREIEHMVEHKDIKHVTLQVESEKHNHDSSILCNVNADSTETHTKQNHYH